ncbi:MAG: DUF5662 family protein [Clostridia bacterium]|nr:DUF5662 family protein [Clostridia bacterium]
MMHIIGHFRTITKHRHMVFIHCVRAGIPVRGLLHDLSKYSPTEFIKGAKYYTGKKSPTEFERRNEGCSTAWMHHKGRNRHHFEYWTDYNPLTKSIDPVKMPIKFVKEMFCDRVAAGKVYLGKDYTAENPIGYFLRGSAKRNMHPETAVLLEGWLRSLRENGEKATFKEIRRTKKY